MIFSELSPLTPERASMTLSRMFCEKFQIMPGSFRSNSACIVGDQLVLGAWAFRAEKPAPPALTFNNRRPVFFRPQRHKELRIVVAVGVGPVVGSPNLVDNVSTSG